jgi:Fe-S-cluster-containing hydrogenase component 2
MLDPEKCTGCALCIPACPGQAIFVVDLLAGQVTLPYEFLPVPTEGELVHCLDRAGQPLQQGRVTRVIRVKGSDDVNVVTVQVDPALADQVRAIRVGGSST